MNYLNDIVNKYRTCKKCGIQKQQLEMCLDVHKNKVDFDSGDWYCEKCYAELYKKQDGDRKKMKDEKIIAFVGGKGQTDLKEAIEVSLKPQMITHEEARQIISLIDGIDNKIMLRYITQQELKEQRAKKVEEVLELYRECNEEGHFWLEIQQRIAQLEKELEELK